MVRLGGGGGVGCDWEGLLLLGHQESIGAQAQQRENHITAELKLSRKNIKDVTHHLKREV